MDRRAIFDSNIKDIIANNSQEGQLWTKGINEYSHLTFEEFVQYFNIVKKDQICTVAPPSSMNGASKVKGTPASWDWRSYGVVTPVKNQGNCGSCWTFSTVGVLESHYLLKYGGLARNLSEQQLVDCAGGFDTFGCSGGLPSHSYEYITYNGGISTEAQYPYTAVNGTCKFKNGMQSVSVLGGSINITTDEVAIAQAVFEVGPTSISFTVTPDFKNYKSGIYINPTCPSGPLDVNHDVVLVGFGNANNTDYWIIKNSWSPNFGEIGFYRIERGVNICGIKNCGSYPQSVIDVAQAVPKVEPRKIYQQAYLETIVSSEEEFTQ